MENHKQYIIEYIGHGFIQRPDNPLISEVRCDYHSGICKVTYRSGVIKEIDIKCEGFSRQYGTPISNDGTKLFIGDWEYHKGLRCYDLNTGELIWKLKNSRNRNIYVYDDYIIVTKANTSIMKISIDDGHVIEEIKSGTIEDSYYLDNRYILVDGIKGKLTIFDTSKMAPVKCYKYQDACPRGMYYPCLRMAYLNLNMIVVSGFGHESADTWRNSTETIDYTSILEYDYKSVIDQYEAGDDRV